LIATGLYYADEADIDLLLLNTLY